ncbi:MAG: TolC family protein [Caulobacteraceae bacterium]
MPFHRPTPPMAALGAALAVLGARAARADTAPSYADLLRQVEATAPLLAESRGALRQSQGLARQAQALTNPTIGVTVENIGAGTQFAAIAPQQTTVQVQQPLELGGKRAARVAVGDAGLDLARAKDLRAHADFAYDLAVAYVAAEADRVRLGLADEALSMAADDARAVSALVEAGREASVRAVQARAAVEAARANRVEAQSVRDEALAKLTALSGSPAPFTDVSGGLLPHGDVLEPVRNVDPLGSPAYLAARAERDLAGRRVRLEKTRAAPDLSASLGLRQLQGVGGGALVAGVSMPLPLFDRNRGSVDAARGELAAADARLDAARFQAEAEARTGQARLRASEARLRAARDTEAAAAEAYRLTRLGYEGGKTSLLELQAARRALTDARAQTLDTRVARLLAEASLARLQGVVPFGDQP